MEHNIPYRSSYRLCPSVIYNRTASRLLLQSPVAEVILVIQRQLIPHFIKFFLRVKTCVSFDTRNSVSCLTIHPVVDIYHSIIKQCPVTAIILLGVEESDDLWQKRFSLAFGSASLSLKKKECKLFF